MGYLSVLEIPAELRERAARIRLVAFDVDGTLSDGKLLYGDGSELKAFHVFDGLGMKLLRDYNIEVALITARESNVVQSRARELGLRHVYQGARDKLDTLEHLTRSLKIDPSQVAYMGDDLPDLPVLQRVGLSAAPANAHAWVRERVYWCSTARGGEGAGRELCDLILIAQGHADTILRRYLPGEG
ncbi:MAG: HAD hydrolase family protein [Lysobacteraceae bacterium]